MARKTFIMLLSRQCLNIDGVVRLSPAWDLRNNTWWCEELQVVWNAQMHRTWGKLLDEATWFLKLALRARDTRSGGYLRYDSPPRVRSASLLYAKLRHSKTAVTGAGVHFGSSVNLKRSGE